MSDSPTERLRVATLYLESAFERLELAEQILDACKELFRQEDRAYTDGMGPVAAHSIGAVVLEFERIVENLLESIQHRRAVVGIWEERVQELEREPEAELEPSDQTTRSTYTSESRSRSRTRSPRAGAGQPQ